MSKGWRARLRRKRCAHCRAARACKVGRERRDDRQALLFAAPPSICEGHERARLYACYCEGEESDGCRPRAGLIPWCEVLEPSERVAVRAALLELRAAAAGDD